MVNPLLRALKLIWIKIISSPIFSGRLQSPTSRSAPASVAPLNTQFRMLASFKTAKRKHALLIWLPSNDASFKFAPEKKRCKKLILSDTPPCHWPGRTPYPLEKNHEVPSTSEKYMSVFFDCNAENMFSTFQREFLCCADLRFEIYFAEILCILTHFFWFLLKFDFTVGLGQIRKTLQFSLKIVQYFRKKNKTHDKKWYFDPWPALTVIIKHTRASRTLIKHLDTF